MVWRQTLLPFRRAPPRQRETIIPSLCTFGTNSQWGKWCMLALATYKCLSQWPPPYMCNVICYIDSGDALILISNWCKSFFKYMIPILAMHEKKNTAPILGLVQYIHQKWILVQQCLKGSSMTQVGQLSAYAFHMWHIKVLWCQTMFFGRWQIIKEDTKYSLMSNVWTLVQHILWNYIVLWHGLISLTLFLG
jgi:hypothetical protein